MTGSLTLICRKCTRQASFTAATVAEAAEAAVNAGWVLTRHGATLEDNRYACPRCPAVRAMTVSLGVA